MTPSPISPNNPSSKALNELEVFLQQKASPELQKVFEQEQIKKATAEGKPITEVIHRPLTTQSILKGFISSYKNSEFMKDMVLKLASVDNPTLIMGDTGTGKEMIAKALHGARTGPFIAINCGGLPNELIESELFGYEKGAFTGAVAGGKVGPLEQAKGGTVLLDEIGDLPLLAQVKLLRAIQEKKIRKVGGVLEISISCRFVCATHRNLEDMVRKELFRKDLYYRLSTFIVKLDPLSSRPRDAADIAKALCAPDKHKYINIQKWYDMAGKGYFDGNVRQIQQIITRCEVLGWDHMPHELK